MADQDGSQAFDVQRIRDLVALMDEHDIGEIDLRSGDERIRLARNRVVAVAPMPTAPLGASQPAVAAPASAPPPAEMPAEDKNIVIIESPMVGTFYTKPNPNAESYVKVGDHVDPETTICMIEAMKVFNEIPADVRGQVVAVLVDDQESVEFGKPLFKVDTSK